MTTSPFPNLNSSPTASQGQFEGPADAASSPLQGAHPVNPTAKLELSILGTALSLGILGDTLLRAFPWGLNAALWFTLMAAAILVFGRSRKELFARRGGWILLPMTLAGLAFLWRESPVLHALNLLCIATALSLSLLRAKNMKLQDSSLMRYALSGLFLFLYGAAGMLFILVGQREWNRTAGWSAVRKVVAVLLGLALAIPLLIIFGALFMSADPVFHNLTLDFLRVFPMHFAIIALIFYIVGGFLRGLILGRNLSFKAPSRTLPISLGTIETAVLLGLINLLFAAFVAVQIRYLFGGLALVRVTTGLTYSEYARSGFWELLAVAIILLPLLLVLHWFLAPENATAQKTFRGLAGTQIALLFVIMASAFERMRLYVQEYGLSEQRFYPTAFMGWLAVVFIWFCLTVLRGKRQHFAFGAVLAGFLLVATLEILNPDAYIARINVERAREGKKLDADYLTGLSEDAIPAIVDRWAALRRADQCALYEGWYDKRTLQEYGNDWSSWNISRALAIRVLRSRPEVMYMVCSGGNR